MTIPVTGWLRHLACRPDDANRQIEAYKKAPLIERGFCILEGGSNQAFQAFQVLIRPLVELSWLLMASAEFSSGSILLASCLPSSTPH